MKTFAIGNDPTHTPAWAIEIAGMPGRGAIRSALERVRHYAVSVRRLEPLFEPGQHEALTQPDWFFARLRADRTLILIASPAEPPHKRGGGPVANS